MNYLVDGRMTRGFAFLAYPVEYRVSGVMTFMVDQDGVVLQKDLGPDTIKIAHGMTRFDSGQYLGNCRAGAGRKTFATVAAGRQRRISRGAALS